MADTRTSRSHVAVKDGLFHDLDLPLEEIRLRGSRCGDCGYAFLGARKSCENCGSHILQESRLSARGVVWSYTIARHRPPGDYKGADPFEPFVIAVVELPEEVRVLAPLKGAELDGVEVGMPVELTVEPLCQDAEGRDVLAYWFRPLVAEARS